MNYKRILLKLSGEALSNDKGFGIDFDYLLEVCKKIKKLVDNGVEVAIVVGGGNFWRGRSNSNMDRVVADNIGMMGTIMNAVAISDAFTQVGQKSKPLSSIEIYGVIDKFNKKDAVSALENKEVVIFGGGTGNPFFSTDSASSLRALEIDADLMIKLTNVNGVYDKDPDEFIDAKMYDEITYQEVIERNLKVMDLTSITICKDNNLPLMVMNINELDNLTEILNGKRVGTIVKN